MNAATTAEVIEATNRARPVTPADVRAIFGPDVDVAAAMEGMAILD